MEDNYTRDITNYENYELKIKNNKKIDFYSLYILASLILNVEEMSLLTQFKNETMNVKGEWILEDINGIKMKIEKNSPIPWDFINHMIETLFSRNSKSFQLRLHNLTSHSVALHASCINTLNENYQNQENDLNLKMIEMGNIKKENNSSNILNDEIIPLTEDNLNSHSTKAPCFVKTSETNFGIKLLKKNRNNLHFIYLKKVNEKIPSLIHDYKNGYLDNRSIIHFIKDKKEYKNNTISLIIVKEILQMFC
jgi:hypothetical protein